VKENKGLYLYCVRGKASSQFTAKGIDGKEKVFVLPYQDVEAVVSNVCLEEFDSEEIKHKAQEDLNWIKNKAQIHEAVIEKAMRYDGKILAVIPMSFGTIFKSREKIKQILDEDYSKFQTILKNLQGKQEWSVKVYLVNRKVLEEEIKNSNEVVKSKEKEIASMPKGMAYFFEKQIKEIIASELNKEIENYMHDFFLILKRYAEIGLKGKILEKEFTGKLESMILNAIYLIQEKNIQDFKQEIKRLNREMEPKGFKFEYSGPWPPYNFVKVQ